MRDDWRFPPLKHPHCVPAIVFLCWLSGCAGHGSLYLVPLDTKRIGQAGELVARVRADECYFWTDEKQQLCLAMRAFEGSILGGRFEKELLASMVLEGLPAGSTRDYRMDQRTFRSKSRAGCVHLRSASLAGVIRVWDYGKERIRGRFRVVTKQQSWSVLTGWTGDARVMVVGEFSAVGDRHAGERIAEQAEEKEREWERH